MDAYELLSLIRLIADTGSRLEKENLLKQLADAELGSFVLTWTYDPMITYGLTAGRTQSADKLNLQFRQPLVEPLLRRLANRELTGNSAQREVSEVMQAFDDSGAELLWRILSKDLDCGIAASTINQAIPGLIPVFAVMRAHPYEPKKIKSWPQKAEFKLDGNRNTFLARNGRGGFYTRTGKIVPALDFLVRPVIEAAKFVAMQPATDPALLAVLTNGTNDPNKLSFMLDGEAMMGLFADTGAFRRKDADATRAELHLYDIMSFDDFDAAGSVGKPLEDRRLLLQQFVHLAKTKLGEDSPIQIVPQFFVNSDEEVQAFFMRARSKTLASYLARGNADKEAELLKVTIDAATGHPKVLEGAMIKNPKGLYDKKKSNGWLKLKDEIAEDLRIVDAYPGEPHTKYEHCLGGLTVEREFNGKMVTVNVGGGFTDLEREQLWELFLHDTVNVPDDELALIGRLIQVEFHEVTPDGSLRHPRFVRFRPDKDGEIEDKEAHVAALATAA
jgi:hypothetical protein